MNPRRPRMSIWMTLVVLASGSVLSSAPRAAEREPPLTPPQVLPAPMSDDDSGFKTIFDGKTFKDWDGDPVYWRIENGAIVGETTEKTIPKNNSFLIWRGGKPRDFELKIEYRVSTMGNSGLQYRSVELPGTRWTLRGYQMDIDGREWGQIFYDKWAKDQGIACNRVTGQNYDERGRTFLALPGQVSYVQDGKAPRVIASLGDCVSVTGVISDEWNKAHLIVRGDQMIHIVNERIMSIVIDDDKKNRLMEGNIAMQVHVGPPMKVEFRNIRLKTL